MAAKLPEHLFKPVDRKLSDLDVGKSAYSFDWAMTVTESGECYLDLNAPMSMTASYSSIRVERHEDGYHVVIVSKDTKWRKKNGGAREKMVPIQSVRDDPDVDFGQKIQQIERDIEGIPKEVKSKD